MSKIIADLCEVKEIREKKAPGQAADAPTLSPVCRETVPAPASTVTIDRGLFNLGLACVVFMGAMALIMSLKAFQQIHRGNETLLKMSRVLVKQEVKLESLANAVEGRGDPVEKRLGKMEKTLQAVMSQVNKNSRDITDLTVNMNLFQVEMNTIHSAQDELFQRIVEAPSPASSNTPPATAIGIP